MTAPSFSLEPLSIPEAGAVGIAASTGFEYVSMVLHEPAPSLRADKIVTDLALRQSTLERMRTTGIQLLNIECFNLTPERSPASFAAGLECGHQLGARTATAIIWQNVDRKDVLRKYRSLCDMASDLGIVVNIEFLAFSSSVNSLESALELARDSGRRNAGVTVDLLHLMRTGGTPAKLGELGGDYIRVAQICDGPLTLDAGAMLEEAAGNRLVPGVGEFPLHDFVRAIPSAVIPGIEVPQVKLIGAVSPLERARTLFDATRALYTN